MPPGLLQRFQEAGAKEKRGPYASMRCGNLERRDGWPFCFVVPLLYIQLTLGFASSKKLWRRMATFAALRFQRCKKGLGLSSIQKCVHTSALSAARGAAGWHNLTGFVRTSSIDNQDKYRWLCWEEMKKQYGETVAQKMKERTGLC